MQELKPCPFCGGKAVVEHWEPSFTDEDFWDNERHDTYDIACSDCGAKTDEYRSKDEAIEAWNRRAEE